VREWWASSELTKRDLPGLWRGSKTHGVRDQARIEGWRKRPHPRRKNAFEYHFDSLPWGARQELWRQEMATVAARSATPNSLKILDVASELLPLLERVQRQLDEPHVWHVGADEIERGIADLRAILVL
jgi:hypothetical protein